MLSIVQHNAFYADRIDFNAARKLVAGAAATSLADVHGVALHVLAELGDRHSMFFTKDEYDRLSAKLGQATTTPTSSTALVDGVGLLQLPPVEALMPSDRATAYFTPARSALASTNACGWIVDLRYDTGGSLPPMLEAVAPLLGPGTFVSYKYRDGHTDRFTINDDLHVQQPDMAPPSSGPRSTANQDLAHVPVAVLTNDQTASAAEGVAMAFVGRPRTTSFGEPTAGVPTGNDVFPMPDGSALILMVGIGVDRTGATHDRPIVPDTSTAAQNGQSDPTKDAADKWLREQPQCSSAGT